MTSEDQGTLDEVNTTAPRAKLNCIAGLRKKLWGHLSSAEDSVDRVTNLETGGTSEQGQVDRVTNLETGGTSEQGQDEPVIPRGNSDNDPNSYNTDEKHFRSWLKFHLYSAIKLQGNSCSIHIVSFILFLMQVIKIILITSQLFSFGKDHGNFSDVVNRGHLTLRHLLLKDWDASWETLAYPPHKGDFAVYTIDDLENGINFAVKGYYNAKREAIGFFQRTTDDTMVIQVKYFDFPGFNDTNVTQGVIIQDKTFSADVGLSLQNQTYTYDIIKELTGNGLEQPIKRMLSTELRFSIHSVRVYEKVRRARCLHVQGWVTFNDMDYNGQVIVNLETLTRRISCKQLNISAQDWALENTSKPLGAVLVIFCLLSMVASTLIIILTVYLCWKTKSYLQKKGTFFNPKSTVEDLPVTQYLRLVNFWEIAVIISDILTLYGTIWIVFENEDSEWIVETLDFYSACLGIGCLFAWISILHFCKFHNKFYLLFRTFYRAFWSVFAYLICVTALFIGFWMCGFVVLGPYHVKFRTAQAAAETLFSMFNGDEIYATFANLETHKIGGKWIWLFSRFYIGTYIVTFTIVVVNLLIAIFISAYESITKNYEVSRNEPDLGQMKKALQGYLNKHSEEENVIRSSILTLVKTDSDTEAVKCLRDQMLKLVNVSGDNKITVIEPKTLPPRTLRAFMNEKEDSSAVINCCGFEPSFLWKKEFGK